MIQFLNEQKRVKDGVEKRQVMYCCPSNQTVDDVTGTVKPVHNGLQRSYPFLLRRTSKESSKFRKDTQSIRRTNREETISWTVNI